PKGPAAVERVGATEFSAVAGTQFAERPRVRVKDGQGRGVKGVKVTFEVRGATGASFEGGVKKVTVSTAADGVATAPALGAGTRTGSFTLRAAVPGQDLGAVDFKASVTAPQADELARTTDGPLEAGKGAEFAEPVEVKASKGGKAVAGVAVSATLADTEGGPFFKGADGKPVHVLEGLKTGADGVLRLPELYAGDTAGTFSLTLKADGGGTLTVKLTVKG
ncbi:hypothetical protein G5C65_14765, partial [Streptomyces sp. SB3404]|nr:hypothetical protein [Streptomyces boncukensis]